ncbi:hypothetical protein NPIL_524541 [Nephila pilipes]|uniref:Uncharacterized protein n=1 Tax=Nephila pilipes TaxID=299642 RepID=A0A8X6QYX6_NEPPI|nr:hypothetical protein NPIL_524541 [Nephila pilipes]
MVTSARCVREFVCEALIQSTCIDGVPSHFSTFVQDNSGTRGISISADGEKVDSGEADLLGKIDSAIDIAKEKTIQKNLDTS